MDHTKGYGKATLETNGTFPQLFIDGKPEEPIFFMSPWANVDGVVEKEADYASCCGVDIWFISYGTEYYDDPPRFREKLRKILRALRAHNSRLHVVLRLDVGGALRDLQVPSSEAMYLNGIETERVSFASEVWYRKATEALVSIVTAVQEDEELRAIVVGYEYLGAQTGEWFVHGFLDGQMDTSECNRKAFADYLRKKYGTDEELQRAYGTKKVTLAKVALPDCHCIPGFGNHDEQRRNVHEGKTLFCEPKDRLLVDYLDYINELHADRITGLAHTIKQACNGEKWTVTYYGYLYELPCASSGHYALTKVLNCPDVDMLSGPVSYTDRNDGGVGAYMTFADTVASHGKLWVDEGDYYSPVHTEECEQAYPATTQLLDQVARRELAKCMIYHTGVWWLDLHGHGWYSYRSFWEESRDMRRWMKRYRQVQTKKTPKICLVLDEPAVSLMGDAYNMGTALLTETRYRLYRSGYRFGSYLLDDLLEGRIDDASVYVMLTPWRLDHDTVQKLEAKLHRVGKTTLWMYGPGLTAKEDFERLLGMPIFSARTAGGYAPILSAPSGQQESGGPLLDPIYYVEGASQVLRTYHGGPAEGKAGSALTVRDGWTSWFYGGMTLTEETIAQLAALAGETRFSSTGDTLYANQEAVMLHAKEDGKKTLTLPGKADHLCLETGERGCGSQVDLGYLAHGDTRTVFYGEAEFIDALLSGDDRSDDRPEGEG